MTTAVRRRISRAFFLRTIKRIGIVSAIMFVIGGIYAWQMDGRSMETWHRGAFGGAAIAAIIMSFHFFYVRGPYGEWVNRLAFPLASAVLGVIYFSVISSVLVILAYIYEAGDRSLFPTGEWFARHAPLRDFIFTLSITVVGMLITTISALLGDGAIRHIASGKYHKPRRESRVAVFIDMRRSTSLAEQLGDQRFYELLNDFFADITEPLMAQGATIDAYVGDGLLATWPKVKAHCALPALREAWARLRKNADAYEQMFGVTPQFRAAIHCGEALIGEIGAEKRQIVTIGDFVNVTARLEAVARERGDDLIVSEEFLNLAMADDRWRATPIEAIQVRGRDTPVKFMALRDTADQDRPVAAIA